MSRRLCVALLAGLALAVSQGGAAAADKADLKVGDKAPAFTGVDDQGRPWKSAEHVGKKALVVYFFPADFTGG